MTLFAAYALPKVPHLPDSPDAAEHGKRRRAQGYSAAMLIEESRLLQVVTFQTLHRHRGEFDQAQVLLDVVLIADDVDFQLMQAVRCFDPQLAQSAA
jgi:hypothetical protein